MLMIMYQDALKNSGHNNSILTIDTCIIQQKEFQCNESKKKTEIKQWDQNKKIKCGNEQSNQKFKI